MVFFWGGGGGGGRGDKWLEMELLGGGRKEIKWFFSFVFCVLSFELGGDFRDFWVGLGSGWGWVELDRAGLGWIELKEMRWVWVGVNKKINKQP